MKKKSGIFSFRANDILTSILSAFHPLLTLPKDDLKRERGTFFSCLVPRRLSFDENVRAKEGGKETTGETSGRSCFQDGGKSNGGRIWNF